MASAPKFPRLRSLTRVRRNLMLCKRRLHRAERLMRELVTANDENDMSRMADAVENQRNFVGQI